MTESIYLLYIDDEILGYCNTCESAVALLKSTADTIVNHLRNTKSFSKCIETPQQVDIYSLNLGYVYNTEVKLHTLKIVQVFNIPFTQTQVQIPTVIHLLPPVDDTATTPVTPTTDVTTTPVTPTTDVTTTTTPVDTITDTFVHIDSTPSSAPSVPQPPPPPHTPVPTRPNMVLRNRVKPPMNLPRVKRYVR